jgi:hypothetical protein
MYNYKSLSVLVAVATLGFSGIVLSENRKSAYYEHMSSIAFVYGLDKIKSEKNESERLKIARELSFMAFTYYVSSEKGEIYMSPKVDKYIQYLYMNLSEELTSMKSCFRDPLIWKNEETSKLSLPKNLEVSKKNYSKLTNDFLVFCEGEKRVRRGE